ncbi:hypothetical protein GCM10019016_037440 [Streptomyces prasinosporus]|uniref:Uncharacterized protein n=1 Tax=Streptomyces prasinosporus TaxID=68256 RepID=A0ABP6TPN7_9ACTN
MPKPDELIVDIAALVESGQSNQVSLTVVTGGAVIPGRLAPEAVRLHFHVARILQGTVGSRRRAGCTA